VARVQLAEQRQLWRLLSSFQRQQFPSVELANELVSAAQL
jgi:hypothetical protein